MRTVNPQRVENRKKEILDAARQCFEQKGFHATTMAEICARAEISPGALYRYFSSKEEIIGAMCDEQQFRSLNLLAISRKKIHNIESFEKELAFIVNDVVENHCSKEHGALAAELIAEAMRNNIFADSAAQTYLAYQNELAEFIIAGQKIGACDDRINANEAAGMLMANVDGLVLRIAFCNDLDKKTAASWLLNCAKRYLCPTNFSKIKQMPNSKLGKVE